MRLEAVLSLDTLASLVRQSTPLKILLGEETGAERYLLLNDPEQIALVPNAGLRIKCKAKVCWERPPSSAQITPRRHSIGGNSSFGQGTAWSNPHLRTLYRLPGSNGRPRRSQAAAGPDSRDRTCRQPRPTPCNRLGQTHRMLRTRYGMRLFRERADRSPGCKRSRRNTLPRSTRNH
jgi:hypothetical protein